MADCFFHTGRPAVTRCKQCGKPLCSACRKITSEGIFCSNECAEAAKIYAERMRQIEQQRASYRGSKWTGIAKLIKIIVFLGILYAIYKFVIARFIK
jgi:recombinational DNA repair protein (RecF pathway)